MHIKTEKCVLFSIFISKIWKISLFCQFLLKKLQKIAGKLTIPSSYVVTSTNLLNLLTNVILARAPPENDEKLKETFEANLGDVMNIMETLVNGLDVNVKFRCGKRPKFEKKYRNLR